MIIGAIAMNTIGSVMYLSFEKTEAPSIVAASYRSSGMDCNTPVETRKMYGNPSQPCMRINASLDQLASVIHGSGSIPKKAKMS